MNLQLFIILIVSLAAILFAATRPERLKRWLLIAILALLNLSALAVGGARFLVSRLDGSRPPTLGEFLAPYSLAILLLLALDALILYFYHRRGLHFRL